MRKAFLALYLYSLDATRSSSTSTTSMLLSQYTNFNSYVHSKVWSSEQYRKMQMSVARLFYVGGYVYHPSVLDTSGTFININPSESELFNLRADNTVVCQFPFLFFSFILIYR